jgi:hypothetical protein
MTSSPFAAESACMQSIFGKIPKYHPSYQFSQIPAMLNQNTSTLSVSGGQKVQFQVPADTWWNPHRTLLGYLAVPSATAGNFNWVPKNVHQFSGIRFSVSQSAKLVDLNFANVMDRVVKPYCTTQKILESKDIFSDGSTTTAGEWFRPLNVNATNANPATAVGDFVRYDGTAPNVAYREFEYCEAETAALNNPGPLHTIKFPLGNLTHTFFELDINVKFPVNCIITFEFAATTQLYWIGTSQTVPTAGAAAATGTVAISNLILWLCVETDTELISKMDAAYEKGITIPYEFAFVQQTSITGTNKSLNTDLDDSYGVLKRVYSSIQNIANSSNTMWDISNLAQAKFTSVQTYIGSSTVEPDALVASDGQDFLTMKAKGYFKNSCILNSNVYQYNSTYINSWEDTSNGLCDRSGLYKNFEQGLKFRQITHTTKFITPSTQAIVNKIFVFQKQITITPKTVKFDP